EASHATAGRNSSTIDLHTPLMIQFTRLTDGHSPTRSLPSLTSCAHSPAPYAGRGNIQSVAGTTGLEPARQGSQTMCGICGWIDFQRDLRGADQTMRDMSETMACRGPDDAGTWTHRHAALAHRRLA